MKVNLFRMNPFNVYNDCVSYFLCLQRITCIIFFFWNTSMVSFRNQFLKLGLNILLKHNLTQTLFFII